MSSLPRVLNCLLFLACLSLAGTQSDETVGNIVYKLPKGWSKAVSRNQVVLKPVGQPASVNCSLTLTADLQARGDLAKWLDTYFTDTVGPNRQIVQKVPLPTQNNPEGWEACALTVTHRAKEGGPSLHHILIVFRRGETVGTLQFVTASAVLIDKYRAEVNGVAASMKPVGGFGSGSTPLSIPPPASGVPQPSSGGGPPIGGKPINQPYLPETLPPPAPMPGGSAQDAAAALAGDILKGGPGGLAALQRAVLASGFGIHNVKTKAVLHAPAAGQANGLSFSDIDLIGANALMATGGSVPVSGVEASFLAQPGLENVKLGDLWVKSFAKARASSKPWNAFFGHLVTELGRQSMGRYSSLEAYDPNARLCAAQTFLLAWRTIGHLIALKKPQSEGLQALIADDYGMEEQGVAAADALADLGTAVESFSDVSWSESINQLLDSREIRVTDLNLYILAMARLQILLGAIVPDIHFASNTPLIRSKEKGKTGEDKLVHIDLKLDADREAWRKLRVAVDRCGYSFGDLDQADGLAKSLKVQFVEAQSETKKIIVQPGDSPTARYTGVHREAARYTLPVTGAEQTLTLGTNPKPRKEYAAFVIRASIGDQTGGQIVRAQSTIQRVVTIPFETIFDTDLETQNWMPTGWMGHFKIEVDGKGYYKSLENRGGFETHRKYVISGILDGVAPIALISGLSAGDSQKAGVYSVMMSRPVSVEAESTFTEHRWETGTELDADCIDPDGKKRSSLTDDLEKRPPTNKVEEVAYLQHYLRLEIDSKNYKYKLKAFSSSLPIYLLNRTFSLDNKKQVSTTTGYVFDGLDYKDNPPIAAGATFTGNIEDEGTYISGGLPPFDLIYKRYRWKHAPKQPVKVKVSWEFLGQVDKKGPALERIASFSMRLLADHAWAVENRPARFDEDMPIVEELTDLATCYGVEAPVQGQLKHTKPPARKGGRAR